MVTSVVLRLVAPFFSCIGLVVAAVSQPSQSLPNPENVFNNPSDQWLYEYKGWTHYESLYTPWTHRLDFNDKASLEELSTELKQMAKQLRQHSGEIGRQELDAWSERFESKYYPFEESKRKLRNDIICAKYETGLDAKGREKKV